MNLINHIPYYDDKFKRAVFLVLSEYCYFDYLGNKTIIYSGFKFDGCSRPWFLEKYLPLNSINNLAFARHDWGYYSQDKTRQQCDMQLFIDLLRNPANSLTKCLAVYLNLRIFGAIAWNENKKLKKTKGKDYFIMPKHQLKQIIDSLTMPTLQIN